MVALDFEKLLLWVCPRLFYETKVKASCARKSSTNNDHQYPIGIAVICAEASAWGVDILIPTVSVDKVENLARALKNVDLMRMYIPNLRPRTAFAIFWKLRVSQFNDVATQYFLA